MSEYIGLRLGSANRVKSGFRVATLLKLKFKKKTNKRELIYDFNRASPGFRFGLANRVGPGSGVATALLVSEPRFRRFYKVILKLFMTCIAFSYKG